MLSHIKNHKACQSLALLSASALALASCQQNPADGGDSKPVTITKADGTSAPCPNNLYFGDTHLHTINSGDAVFNGVKLTPEDALRYARGEEVKSTTGQMAKLNKPIDFLVVSDHSELMGFGAQLMNRNEELLKDPTLKRWSDMMNGSLSEAAKATGELVSAYSQGNLPAAMTNPEVAGKVFKSTWQSYLDTIERYNEPGKFTAFAGYEYTLMPKGDNLHRIVIFKDGKDVIGDTLPFSSIIGPDVEQLWEWMGNYASKSGGDIMAIPHNGNVSNGLMFMLKNMKGEPFTKEYAETRAKWEPLVETTQIKGDSEAHPALSPDDEFASFGKSGWDKGNLDFSSPKTPDMLPAEYSREALKRGLMLEAQLGANPYKFGLIGATDNHNGLAVADDKNYWGKYPSDEPKKERALEGIGHGEEIAIKGRVGWENMAGGYAGVWAAENSRASIFEAMQRKEVFATTGPRMTVRMFAGFGLGEDDLNINPCELYQKAVPMGGDIPASGQGNGDKAPSFLVTAQKDPDNANLDRIQIVKGWLDDNGATHEKIYDIAWSEPNKRKMEANGKLTPVGDTVDIANATWEDSIGAPELKTVWTDPDFDASERAFYYVRVLEIPTPRWPVYDAKKYGTVLPKDAILKHQHRVYGSPVWFTPKG